MAHLYDYQTGTELAPASDLTPRLAGALADTTSPEGLVLARLTPQGWDYVRPDERKPGDVVVYCD